jgi:tetraacyldisaccharide-1-P 4'-kinase
MANRGRSENRRLGVEQQQTRALDLAVAALGFIAGEPQRLDRFLEMTGVALESLREASRETHFLAGVLDHISGDEPLLLAFAAQTGIDPNEVMRARAVLTGHCWERDTP